MICRPPRRYIFIFSLTSFFLLTGAGNLLRLLDGLIPINMSLVPVVFFLVAYAFSFVIIPFNIYFYSITLEDGRCICKSGWIFRRIEAINLCDLRYAKIISFCTFRICILNAESAKLALLFADRRITERITEMIEQW